jgi:hypothetical protein
MSPSVAGSDVRRSSHICLPFETEDEKHEATVTFIHEGLSRGARCLFTGTKDDFETLGRGLEERGICTRRASARGALKFVPVEDIYFPDGTFEPPRSLDITDGLIDEALADGFTGLRLTAELTRIPEPAEWQKIVWYEAMINERFARRPIAGMCRYPRDLIPAERVRDLLRTHPVAVVRGESCENPFYERPEIVLSGDVQAQIDWQFRQLRVHQRTRQHLEGTRSSAVAAAAELAGELHHLRSRAATGRRSRTEPRAALERISGTGRNRSRWAKSAHCQVISGDGVDCFQTPLLRSASSHDMALRACTSLLIPAGATLPA